MSKVDGVRSGAAAGKSAGVQKGFLKSSRSIVVKTSEMKVDRAEEKHFFAFVGFPAKTDPLAACNFISDQCRDYLPEFALKVIGFAEYSDGDTTVRAIGVEFLVSQRDALDNAVFQLRDQWYFQKVQLSPAVGITRPEVFSWPEISALIGTPRGSAAVVDPLFKADPWQSFIKRLCRPCKFLRHFLVRKQIQCCKRFSMV